MNRAAFYDSIRPHLNLTTQNVSGTEKVLTYAEARQTPLTQLAYILATAWWESAQTMHPVVEAYWLSEDWRRRNLRYYPWHGRGLIQTTWKENYARMGREIGVDLTADPNKLLEWDYALPALFLGMERGLYTGRSLDNYILLGAEPDYVNARRIVNGTDKARTIARLAERFEAGLRAANYGQTENRPAGKPVEPDSPHPPQDDTPKPETPSAAPAVGRLLAKLLLSILMLLRIDRR